MMDISAKRAEEIAYNLQLSGVSGSTWRATEVEASNMLRALAAERDALRAAICEWAASIYGYEGVLFLEGLKHEKFINSILDAERDRVEGEQKE
jgi:hypothetical protein